MTAIEQALGADSPVSSIYPQLCGASRSSVMRLSICGSNPSSKKNLKKSNRIAEDQSLGVEMLEILYSYYLLRSISNDHGSDDSLGSMRKMKIVQLLTNDIVLRLCKFRDDDSRSLSFDQVHKALRKREAKKNRVDGLEKLIKEYRSLTRNLESHRDAYIAHLSKRDREHLRPLVELGDAIEAALTITDQLCGATNSYRVLDLDLRHQFRNIAG